MPFSPPYVPHNLPISFCPGSRLSCFVTRYDQELLAPRSAPKLDDHALSKIMALYYIVFYFGEEFENAGIIHSSPEI
jgi:hypothetical protein